MKIAFLLVVFLIQSFSFAISETNYQEKWEADVFPFFLDHTELKYMMSHDNEVRLHYGILPNSSAKANGKVIVILTGRTEPFYKYSEVAYDLYQEGYSFAFLDHRGQGGSERELADPEKGHVKSFKYYVRDLEHFMDQVVSKLGFKENYLLAHSMGAAAALMLMAERAELFDKAVVSSPMLKPNTGKFKPNLALAYATALRLIGKGDEYAPGEKGYETPVFEGNQVTGSRARRSMAIHFYEEYDEFKMGGVTVDWVATSIGTNNRFTFKYKKIKTPLLIFQAGLDTIVYTDRHDKLCKKAKDCTLVKYPTGKHELLMEVDTIRDDLLSKAIDFYSK